jgi:hypothetical protein
LGSVATILACDARARWARLAAHAALSNKSAMTTAWPRRAARPTVARTARAAISSRGRTGAGRRTRSGHPRKRRATRARAGAKNLKPGSDNDLIKSAPQRMSPRRTRTNPTLSNLTKPNPYPTVAFSRAELGHSRRFPSRAMVASSCIGVLRMGLRDDEPRAFSTGPNRTRRPNRVTNRSA